MELSNSSNIQSAMLCNLVSNGAQPQPNNPAQPFVSTVEGVAANTIMSQNSAANMSINNSVSQSAAQDLLNQSAQEPNTGGGVTYWSPSSFIPPTIPQSTRPPPSYEVAVKTASDGAGHNQGPSQMSFFTPTSAESSGGAPGDGAGTDQSGRFRAPSIPSAQSSLRQPLQTPTLIAHSGGVLPPASLGNSNLLAAAQSPSLQQLLAQQEHERLALLRKHDNGSEDGVPVADHSGPISKDGVITGEHGSWCSANIFVANIPSFWTEDLLREHYNPYGTIVSVKVVPSRRFGFVRFSKVEEAQKAIIETDKTRPTPGLSLLLHVSMAVHDEGDGSKPNNRIFVRGLPEWATDQLLYEAVKDFATPSKCSILIDAQKRCKGTAFIEFDTVEEATKLMDQAANITLVGGPNGEVRSALISGGTGEGIELKYSEPSESRLQRAARNKERVKKHMNDKVKVQAQQLQQQHYSQQQLFLDQQQQLQRQSMLPFHSPTMHLQQYPHPSQLGMMPPTLGGISPAQLQPQTYIGQNPPSTMGPLLMGTNTTGHSKDPPPFNSHFNHYNSLPSSHPSSGNVQPLLGNVSPYYNPYNNPPGSTVPSVGQMLTHGYNAFDHQTSNNKTSPYHHPNTATQAQQVNLTTSFPGPNSLTLPNHSTTLSETSLTSSAAQSRTQWVPNAMAGSLQLNGSMTGYQHTNIPQQPFHFDVSSNNLNSSYPPSYVTSPTIFNNTTSAPPLYEQTRGGGGRGTYGEDERSTMWDPVGSNPKPQALMQPAAVDPQQWVRLPDGSVGIVQVMQTQQGPMKVFVPYERPAQQ